MEEERQLRRYGNSFVVSIPRRIVELLDFDIDDFLLLSVINNKLIIKKKENNGN